MGAPPTATLTHLGLGSNLRHCVGVGWNCGGQGGGGLVRGRRGALLSTGCPGRARRRGPAGCSRGRPAPPSGGGQGSRPVGGRGSAARGLAAPGQGCSRLARLARPCASPGCPQGARPPSPESSGGRTLIGVDQRGCSGWGMGWRGGADPLERPTGGPSPEAQAGLARPGRTPSWAAPGGCQATSIAPGGGGEGGGGAARCGGPRAPAAAGNSCARNS